MNSVNETIITLVVKALLSIGLELPNTFKYICENYETLSEKKIERLISTGNSCNTLDSTSKIDFIKLSGGYTFDFLLKKLKESLEVNGIFTAMSIAKRLHLNKLTKTKINQLWEVFTKTPYTRDLYIITKDFRIILYSIFQLSEERLIRRANVSSVCMEIDNNNSRVIVGTAPNKSFVTDLDIDVRTDSEKDIGELLKGTRDIQFPFVKVPSYKTVFGRVVSSCKNSETFVRCRTLQDEKGALILCGVFGIAETNFLLETRGMKKVSKKGMDFYQGVGGMGSS